MQIIKLIESNQYQYIARLTNFSPSPADFEVVGMVENLLWLGCSKIEGVTQGLAQDGCNGPFLYVYRRRVAACVGNRAMGSAQLRRRRCGAFGPSTKFCVVGEW